MKSFDTELKKYAEKINLRVSEREMLRERILSYMEYHPLPKAKHSTLEAISSERFFAIGLPKIPPLYTRAFAGVFMLLIIVSVPFAAEHATPGNVLYPVKTKLNENIRSQFVNSPYEKVVFETELMQRRIAEARLLVKEGKMTKEIEAELAVTVKNHATAAQEGIAELKENNADEGAIAEIAFGSALDVQSAVIGDTFGADVAGDTVGIAEVVRDAKATSDAQKGTSTPSYDPLMARVEQETTRAHELLRLIKKSATDAENRDIERRLSDIATKIQKAETAHLGDDPQSGAAQLATTLGDIQKLISFMTDIDLRQNIELETLVPIVLTKEERTNNLKASLYTLESTWATVKPRLAYVANTELLEKLTLGQIDIDANIVVARTALEGDDIVSAEAAVTASAALLKDIDTLTLDIVVPVDETSTESIPAEAATTTTPVATSTNSGV